MTTKHPNEFTLARMAVRILADDLNAVLANKPEARDRAFFNLEFLRELGIIPTPSKES